jgi:HAE1 family hydrophobic/amphiphilic exporter-1
MGSEAQDRQQPARTSSNPPERPAPASPTTTRPAQTSSNPSPQPPADTTTTASPDAPTTVPPASPQTPQTGAPTSSQDLTTPVPLIKFEDVPQTRIGVDAGNVVSITMYDAVLMAVRRNLDIEVSRFDVKRAEYDLFAARGAYDPIVGADVAFRSITEPVTSVFGGADDTGSRTFKDLTVNLNYDQLYSRGGRLTGGFNSVRQTTSATFATINPTYQPTLNFTFTQPILRNFDIDSTRRQIELAKRQLDLSDAQFRQRVIDTINAVQLAYWDLVYALRNEQIQRESVQLARVQLENNLRQVEAGTLAPIELRSTESDLETRKEAVITALQQITEAENRLKNLTIADPGDPMWSARIVPVDPAELVPVGTDLDSAIGAAITNRPELEQLKYQTQLKEVDERFFKDQLKPQVDLFGTYQLTGTAGTAVDGGTSTVGALSDFDLALINSLNQVRGDLGRPPFPTDDFHNPMEVPNNVVPERFQGGFIRSLGNLFSNDFRTYQVGVRVSFPLGNNVAEANYGRTLAELRQLDAQQRRLIQSIQVEVRNALQAVDAARQRFEAARASRIAAEAQLQGEEERFRAGLSTNFFVLDRQNQLSAARGREAQALTDYNKAIADLQRVTGTTMVANNVVVSNQP